MLIASGISGELLVGYRHAANLGNWQIQAVEAMGGRKTLTARIVSHNSYWLNHGERFVLRLVLGNSTWQWRQIEIRQSGNAITANLMDEPEIV